MHSNHTDEVLALICHHRGIGEENMLDSIRSAISTNPYLAEFDVRWQNGELRLGHPPVDGNEPLSDALKLFENTSTLPKVDMKLTNEVPELAIDGLVKQLDEWSPRKVLVNVGGDLNADGFFKAEKQLVDESGDNVLLNIDFTQRYAGKTAGEIDAHLESLKRPPFSISPNLEDSTDEAIQDRKSVV